MFLSKTSLKIGKRSSNKPIKPLNLIKSIKINLETSGRKTSLGNRLQINKKPQAKWLQTKTAPKFSFIRKSMNLVKNRENSKAEDSAKIRINSKLLLVLKKFDTNNKKGKKIGRNGLQIGRAHV